MPKLIKLYIQQCLIGFGISALFLAMLLWFNVANLWHLVTHDSMGWLALLMIWIFNGSVFGAVQFAISVMRMKDDDDDQGPGGGTRVLAYATAKGNSRIERGNRLTRR